MRRRAHNADAGDDGAVGRKGRGSRVGTSTTPIADRSAAMSTAPPRDPAERSPPVDDSSTAARTGVVNGAPAAA